MTNTPDNRLIDLIYRKKLGELSEDEDRELQANLKGCNKLHLLDDTLNPREIEVSFSKLSKINEKLAYKKIQKKLNLNTSGWLQIKWWRYAAAIMLPVFMVMGLYVMKPSLQTGLSEVKYHSIKPGKPQAKLILASGDSFELQLEKDTLYEADNFIAQNRDNTLVYSQFNKILREKEEWHTLVVPRGGEYKVVLNDGTQIWLNASSSLSFPANFSGYKRNVRLEGEAFFEVARDENKPFIVEVDGMNVEVLGTSFNIMAYGDEQQTATTLVEGSVAIKTLSDDIVIAPGQQAVYSVNGGISVKDVDTEIYASWRDKVFVFDNEPLESIFRKLGRWYTIDVDYIDPSIKELHFTGYFKRYDEIDKILNYIEATNKVEFTIDKKHITVKKRSI